MLSKKINVSKMKKPYVMPRPLIILSMSISITIQRDLLLFLITSTKGGRAKSAEEVIY